MSVSKRGKFYVYEFEFHGKRIRVSTKQENYNEAVKMERAHRTDLALGGRGLGPKKPSPELGTFITERVMPLMQKQFEISSPKTWFDVYRPNLRAIVAYKPIAEKPIAEITREDAGAYAAYRLNCGLQISTVNLALRTLVRVLGIAVELGVIPAYPKIKSLRGEKHRDRVITPLEEAKYLSAAPPLMADVATILFNTGIRPDECHRLLWENILWDSGKYGAIRVSYGKSKAAHRIVPMFNPTIRAVLLSRWEAAGKPTDGFVFPARTKTGHIISESLVRQHSAAFSAIADYAEKHNEKPVTYFVLYAARHTFLTRLGASGCDAWTLMRIAGHSSITMSQRYVHPDHSNVVGAMERMSTPKIPAFENLKLLPGVN